MKLLALIRALLRHALRLATALLLAVCLLPGAARADDAGTDAKPITAQHPPAAKRKASHHHAPVLAAPVVAQPVALSPDGGGFGGFLSQAGPLGMKVMLAPGIVAALLSIFGFSFMFMRHRARLQPVGLGYTAELLSGYFGLGNETVAAPPPSQLPDTQGDPNPAVRATPSLLLPMPAVPPGFDAGGFLGHAKLNFIRFLEANQRRDLAQLQDVTTEALYGVLATGLKNGGSLVRHADVVTLEAVLLEVLTERDAHWASVRFSGLVREQAGRAPEPFAELWHLTKPLSGGTGWLVAQIEPVY